MLYSYRHIGKLSTRFFLQTKTDGFPPVFCRKKFLARCYDNNADRFLPAITKTDGFPSAFVERSFSPAVMIITLIVFCHL
jgi:hypothetical protein